jgi:hypothetical protein
VREKKTRFPVMLVALLLMLSLTVLGVGHGLWSKLLIIKGTVETGTVDAKWEAVICTEFYTWPDMPQGSEDFGEFEGKDVGSTIAKIDTEDDQILHITVFNGYPSYAVDCQVHFKNDGTIPVKIRGFDIVPVSTNLTNCTLSGTSTKKLECDQLTVIFFDGIGSQVDPEDMSSSSVMLHVEQPADQNSTYEFDVRVCLAQWNEDATFTECIASAP